jgi:hypothetical protein
MEVVGALALALGRLGGGTTRSGAWGVQPMAPAKAARRRARFTAATVVFHRRERKR